MKVFKVYAGREKNAAMMQLYYIRAKSKGQAKELFKSLHKGYIVFSIDECGIRETSDIENRLIPILGLAP